MLLQVKSGDHEAKHETAEECTDMFKKILRAAQRKKEGHPIWCNQELYLSHDNATFFKYAKKPSGEGEVYTIIRPPPNSPDCHKVAEHPIHAIKALFRKTFTQLVGKVSHRRAMDMLVECVKEAVDAESISDDCLTMNETLRSIKKNGGDWADPGLR